MIDGHHRRYRDGPRSARAREAKATHPLPGTRPIKNAGIALFGPTAEFDVSASDEMFASDVRAPFVPHRDAAVWVRGPRAFLPTAVDAFESGRPRPIRVPGPLTVGRISDVPDHALRDVVCVYPARPLSSLSRDMPDSLGVP
jgi:hypothetical protein